MCVPSEAVPVRSLFAVILAALVLSATIAVEPVAAQSTPASWIDLAGVTYPESVSTSNDLLGRQIVIAPADPISLAWGNPRRLAYCANGGIQRSTDSGQTWTAVPTDAVVGLAASTRYPLAAGRGAAPACQSVVLDRTNPDAFFAVFGGVKAPQDAPPPWFPVGYYTRDAGKTWQAAPTPSDTSAQFRGFVSDANGIQALYAKPSSSPAQNVTPPVVSLSMDAGQSWNEVSFGCPVIGPCVRFGEPPTAIGSCN